jgi:hypothetical protein
VTPRQNSATENNGVNLEIFITESSKGLRNCNDRPAVILVQEMRFSAILATLQNAIAMLFTSKVLTY